MKILMEIEEDRNITAKDVFKNQRINHNKVSYDTINRFININGFEARIKRNVLSLKDIHLEKRLSYTNDMP